MIVKDDALKHMRSHLEQAYPHEGCGVMLGSDGVITMVHRGTNIRQDRREDRFLLDPSDIVHAEKLARQKRVEIMGFYHSHPDHPARPSLTDREDAWEGRGRLGRRVDNGRMGDIGVFRLSEDGADFVQETFTIED
ncbi:MAG: M67 family metallopeptidase [Deltaproteobacteria bacterium]|nr:M67 family metallopeptidase [Deltaproteobacteria bacterium]